MDKPLLGDWLPRMPALKLLVVPRGALRPRLMSRPMREAQGLDGGAAGVVVEKVGADEDTLRGTWAKQALARLGAGMSNALRCFSGPV